MILRCPTPGCNAERYSEINEHDVRVRWPRCYACEREAAERRVEGERGPWDAALDEVGIRPPRTTEAVNAGKLSRSYLDHFATGESDAPRCEHKRAEGPDLIDSRGDCYSQYWCPDCGARGKSHNMGEVVWQVPRCS